MLNGIKHHTPAQESAVLKNMRYSSAVGLAALLGGLELAVAQTTIPVYGQCGGANWTGGF